LIALYGQKFHQFRQKWSFSTVSTESVNTPQMRRERAPTVKADIQAAKIGEYAAPRRDDIESNVTA